MRLRLKLLRIIMRNCKPLFFIPIIIAYCLLPGVSAIKYFYVDPSEARSTFIYMAQVFIPLCGLLWPMGYLHVWVEGVKRFVPAQNTTKLVLANCFCFVQLIC